MNSKTVRSANKKPQRRGHDAVPQDSAASKVSARTAAEQTRRTRNRMITWVTGVAVALAATFGLYTVFNHANSSGSGAHAYQVGSPGIGAQAPGFSLSATSGGTVSLSSLRGRTVLLYFQEGLDCQPCWTQIQQLEAASAQVKAAGIDQVISITTNPVDLLSQRVKDMSLSTTVLSDPTMSVSDTYHANQYGMMGASADGHSFVLVGSTGKILWRADYGGAPNYTMDVSVTTLLADLKAGEAKTS
jgi:peroxiredoxin Q/BCP